MTDEDMSIYETQMKEAQTPEERQRVTMLWSPHIVRCLASTNRHIKAIEKKQEDDHRKQEEDREDLRHDIRRLFEQREADREQREADRAIKWKDDKMGWLRQNWMWVVVMLYIAQSLLGVNVGDIIHGIINRSLNASSERNANEASRIVQS